MVEMDADLLLIADACACSATRASLKTKHFNARIGAFAAKTFSKSEFIGSYFETLVHHEVSSREQERKLCWDVAPKVGVAHFFKYALQVRVQRRRLERATKRLGNNKGIHLIPVSSCACVDINDFC